MRESPSVDPGLAHRVLHRYAAAGRRRPLFVTGWRGNGVDWLVDRLNAHPRIAVRPGHDVIAERYNPIVRALLGDRATLSAAEGARLAAMARRATEILDLADPGFVPEQGAGPTYAGTAHPNNALNLMLLSDIFPGARILWVDRNPRDAALAYWTARAGAEATDRGAFRAYAERAMRDLAGLSAARTEAGRCGARLLTIRFERLASAPADAFAELARWLGLDPVPPWLSAEAPADDAGAAPDPAALDAAYDRHFPVAARP